MHPGYSCLVRLRCHDGVDGWCFFANRASRSSGVSLSLVPLSMLMWKIMPPNPGGKVGQPKAVFVEPVGGP
jgi:hypothetical protein